MKIILISVFWCYGFLAISQVTPYTGGEGSGFAANVTPISNCTMFFGDSASGFSRNTTPTIICSMFFGDSADGAANNYSATIICPNFFGGLGDGFAMDSTNLCQNTLPISLLDFYGVKETTRNILYWKIDLGTAVQSFELQRTSTGNSFHTIGTVQGTSNLNHLFTYIDDNPPTGANYYRLRIKESNGTISFSPIIVLKSFSGTQFSVYPNPAHNEVVLFYHAPQPINGTIKLIGMNGETIFTKLKYFSKGANYIQLDLSLIPSGNYIITLDLVNKYRKLSIIK